MGNNLLTWILKEKALVKQTCDFLIVSRPTEKSRPSFVGKPYSGHQQVKKKMGREIKNNTRKERESPPSIGTAKRKERRRGGVWNCVWKKKPTKEKEKKNPDVNWPTSWLDQLNSPQTNVDTHPIRLILLLNSHNPFCLQLIQRSSQNNTKCLHLKTMMIDERRRLLQVDGITNYTIVEWLYTEQSRYSMESYN